MTAKIITFRRIKNAIRKRVEDSPNFVYDTEFGCRYLKDGKPDCLIGCALYDLKVPKKCLQKLDTAWNDDLPCSVSDNGFYKTLAEFGHAIEPSARLFAQLVQDNQDGGAKWKDAYESALVEMEEENDNKAELVSMR